MNFIKEVFFRDDNKIFIKYLDQVLWLSMFEKPVEKMEYGIGSREPLPMTNFSKDDLIHYQYVLLHAYVYLHDSLEDGIKNNASKKALDGNRSQISIIRKLLRGFTNYIDQYDELVKGYEDII